MALINWNDTLSVNIKGLDNQHKRLVDIINELHDAMKNGQSKTMLSKILYDLSGYAKTHFKSEEELFEKYHYQDKIKHKKEHDAFVDKVGAFINDFNNGKVGLSIEVMNFLNTWLINHIKGSDKAYSSFLNNHGIN